MLKAGDLIGGKYRIVRLIGDGGMGSVYEARHEGLGTSVALKCLHEDLADRPGLTERFLREARVAATIASPHVARVTDVDKGPAGLPYLVMELLGGESLQALLDRERKLRPDLAIDYALQIAAGIEAAHAAGVVHRDLKPDNVFVTSAAGGPVLKLIDFGIAKVLAGPEGRGLTRTGVVLGTAEYMPPEQLYAASDVDARTDVYALGVMLFEMLSGRRPADGEDAQQIVGKVLSGEVLSLAALEPSLPAGLVDLVRRATAGDRNARIGSAVELRTALAAFAGATSPAGALAARATPLEPAPAVAAKTLAPDERDAFAKGSTEEAPRLAAGIHAPAASPLIASVPARAASSPTRRRRSAWPAVIGVVVLCGAAGAGIAIWAPTSSPLPPPPLDPNVTPPNEAFTAEGQAPTSLPTPSPHAGPVAQPGTTHEQHGGTQAADAGANITADAGLFPIPLNLPSTFPPLPLPSTFPTAFPTTLPTVLPSGLPTALPSSFPGFPGFPPLPTAQGSKK